MILFHQTNPDWMQDVAIEHGQCLLQQPIRRCNLRTHLLYTVLHLPLVDRRGSEPREPDNPGPTTLRSMAPKNPGAGTTSPMAVHRCMLGPEPHITMSKRGSLTTLFGRGSVLSASMLSTPSRALLATTTSRAGIPCKRGAPLPPRTCIAGASYACITGTSCACIIGASCTYVIDHSLEVSKTDAHLPSTRGLLTRFGTMGTRLTRLKEKDRGPTTSQPTRPRDPGHEAHNLRHLRDI
jgi:hypothetical protein